MKRLISAGTLLLLLTFATTAQEVAPLPAGKSRYVLHATYFAPLGNALPYTVRLVIDSGKSIDFITKDKYIVLDLEPGRHFFSFSWDGIIQPMSDASSIFLSEGKSAYLHFLVDGNVAGGPVKVSDKPFSEAYKSRRPLYYSLPEDN